MKLLVDQSHRDRALNVHQSYIVQAPAGSGKTELLSLRYLKLLAVCEHPEEVLAITFTRKAASEMRDRIIERMTWAASFSEDEKPDFTNELDKHRFSIARQALRKNHEHNWQILQNPSRLRIQTIDSFCLYLSNRIPILSRLGGSPNISEDVQNCFVDAVRNTLQELNNESFLADDIELLLEHLDNNIGKAEELLVGLLHNRDQWLTHILDINAASVIDKAYLQQSLTELINEAIHEAIEGILEFEAEVLELFNFASSNLDRQDLLHIKELPEAAHETMPYWEFLVNMLLTKSGTWRKSVSVRDGFPPGDKTDKSFDLLCKQTKQLAGDLLGKLRDNDDLLETLNYLRLLPNPAYEEQQWVFLTALARILAHLSGQLLLSFRRFKIIDHTQTGAAALSALGTDSNPTDLALALDHSINHILIDEFQDTSKLQIEILKLLTAGWQPEDGRTLFLVGDAMQSCYGFRNANVGIYLSVQEDGIGDIRPESLTLQTNFRSQAHLVNWVNAVFYSAFPQQPNRSRGAVPFTQSSAWDEALNDQGVRTELIVHEPTQQKDALKLEAKRVTEHIKALRKEDPECSIAILVRNRSHLKEITPALRNADIQWQSTDIERLESLPVIEDLLSLTRAILNLGDRVAWLALLRAPWCGLTVKDLLAIESFAGDRSIWYAMQELQDIQGLSVDGRTRAMGFRQVISFAVAMRYRCQLRQIVETSWSMLQGAACAEDSKALESVAQFFNLLSDHEMVGGIGNVTEFETKVSKSFIPSTTATAGSGLIHILTMHKAKGLEFDHVILPGLAAGTGSDSKSLLQWHERINHQGESRLFVAARSPSGKDEDSLYTLLRHEQKYKSTLEDTRLLYIATTRARKSVQLFATLQQDSKGEFRPRSESLLMRIWRELQKLDQDSITKTLMTPAPTERENEVDSLPRYPLATPLKRLRQPLQFSEDDLNALTFQAVDNESDELQGTEIQTALSDKDARIGTLIHSALEAAVNCKAPVTDSERLANLKQYWRINLADLVEDEKSLTQALQFIEQSVVNSLGHPRESWIFDPSLEMSSTELAVTDKTGGRTANYVIDRSFVDSQGNRWIIDYKTAARPHNQDLDSFINCQLEQHHRQLQNYRELLQRMDHRPVKLALFLTSIPRLVELN